MFGNFYDPAYEELVASEEANEYKLGKLKKETNESDASVLDDLECRDRLREAVDL